MLFRSGISNIVRKIKPKKDVEIPIDYSSELYSKLSESREAMKFMRNQYGIKFSFEPCDSEIGRCKEAWLTCKKGKKSSYAYLSAEDDSVDVRKAIYQAASNVL